MQAQSHLVSHTHIHTHTHAHTHAHIHLHDAPERRVNRMSLATANAIKHVLCFINSMYDVIINLMLWIYIPEQYACPSLNFCVSVLYSTFCMKLQYHLRFWLRYITGYGKLALPSSTTVISIVCTTSVSVMMTQVQHAHCKTTGWNANTHICKWHFTMHTQFVYISFYEFYISCRCGMSDGETEVK